LDGEQGLTYKSYAEIFERLCPYYMSIGMSYDDFWNGDVAMVKAYRVAYELQEKRRNQELWLQGMYFYEALCDASPLFRFSMKKGIIKPEPYLREPYPITAAEVREREERQVREREERIKAGFAVFAESVRKRLE
jgi:hypothetical protein